MEEIREALERAKASDPLAIEQRDARARRRIESRPVRLPTIDAPIQEFEINTTHLQSKRIIAHDHTEPQSTSFDMLRTQVLQSMDQKDWKILGVTSPTPGCGKTVTAINLALSVARQPERSVLLVDLDLRKPQVAELSRAQAQCRRDRVSSMAEQHWRAQLFRYGSANTIWPFYPRKLLRPVRPTGWLQGQ